MFNLEIPLEIAKGLSNERCMEKDEARFECRFNKEVKPEDIVWVRDGVKLKDGDADGRIQIINDGVKQILVIKNAHLDDAGTYEIRVKDVKSVGKLQVKEEPVVFVRKLDDTYTAVEKQSVTMECEVNKDNVKCVWKRYGKVIGEDERTRIEVDGRVHRITISNLNMQDKQNLACVAVKGRNDDDELAATFTKLVIKGKKLILFVWVKKYLIYKLNKTEGPLEIVKGLEDTKAKEGTDGLLTVELNKPNEEVEWYKDGVKIRSDSNNRIYSNNNKYYLRINNSDPKTNTGVYTFKVRDLETTARFDVEEKPIEIVSSLKDKTCHENQTVKFEIELNKPDVLERLVWYKDGKEIDFSNDEVKANFELKAVGPKYSLIVKKAQFDDEGEYTVKVKDSDVSSSAKLSVEGNFYIN